MLREGQDSVDAGGVAEGDEPEAPGPSGSRVLHHHHLCNVAKLREVLPDSLGSGLPGEPANEHLARVVGNLVQIDGSEWGEHPWHRTL